MMCMGYAYCLPVLYCTTIGYMVRLNVRIALAYQVQAQGADFIFNIQAAYTPLQKVSAEQLVISPMGTCEQGIDDVTNNRTLRLHATAGPLALTYVPPLTCIITWHSPPTCRKFRWRSCLRPCCLTCIPAGTVSQTCWAAW